MIIDLTMMFLFLIILSIPKVKKTLCLMKWKHALKLKRHDIAFHQLFQPVNGFRLSQEARKQNDAMEYVYGEIEFIPFIALLTLAQLKADDVFYDLGSGTGKAVIACAMTLPVMKATGIELFKTLHQCSCEQKIKLAKDEHYKNFAAKINFIQGNFLKENLDEATFIYIDSTALFNPTWAKLCKRLEQLPYLHTIITTSKALHSEQFYLFKYAKVQMSWGVTTAFIHKRNTSSNELDFKND